MYICKHKKKNLRQNNILRGGAVVARWAHNPKVAGSNPTPATKKKPCTKVQGFFAEPLQACLQSGSVKKA